jgi:hypothetical protein
MTKLSIPWPNYTENPLKKGDNLYNQSPRSGTDEIDLKDTVMSCLFVNSLHGRWTFDCNLILSLYDRWLPNPKSYRASELGTSVSLIEILQLALLCRTNWFSNIPRSVR